MCARACACVCIQEDTGTCTDTVFRVQRTFLKGDVWKWSPGFGKGLQVGSGGREPDFSLEYNFALLEMFTVCAYGSLFQLKKKNKNLFFDVWTLVLKLSSFYRISPQ